MNLGVVTGTVTATVKHPVYRNRRLMVVALCAPDWTRTGRETLAVDTVGSGVGDRVLVLKEGNSARSIFGEGEIPMQEMIVGIVDRVDGEER